MKTDLDPPTRMQKILHFFFLMKASLIHCFYRSGHILSCMRQTMCSPLRWFRPCTSRGNFFKISKVETNHSRWKITQLNFKIFERSIYTTIVVNSWTQITIALVKNVLFDPWSNIHCTLSLISHKIFISNSIASRKN